MNKLDWAKPSGRRDKPPSPTVTKLSLVIVLMACGTSVASAQIAVSPAFEQPPQASNDRASVNTEPAVASLTIYPAAAPDPLLRYRFWPASQDRVEADASALISRAILMNTQFHSGNSEEFYEKYDRWTQMSLDELPIAEVQEVIDRHASTFDQLERAENLMRMDYNMQLEGLSTSETVAILLPEFQESRSLARLLRLRARLAIAEGRWDDAIADLRLGFRLAEAIGNSNDFLIARLIGYAISGMMMETIQEAIQQPGCPNLYWAITALPAEQLFEIRESIEYEATLLTRVVDHLDDLPAEPIGPEAARAMIREVAGETTSLIGSLQDNTFPGELFAGAYVVMFADASRDFLAETTSWGERAYELSPSEAVLRATVLKLERARDSWLAWSLLPRSMWNDYEVEQRFPFPSSHPSELDYATALAGLLTPAIDAARSASLRGQQQQHVLATIEAIRMHAAQAGELPKSLGDLQPVPAWDDPLAGEDFDYQWLSSDKATLTRVPRYPGDQETTFKIQLKVKP